MWLSIIGTELWDNKAILASLSSIIIAQVIKVPIFYVTKRKWDFSKMITTGGMPSSHSAAVSSLATVIGIRSGLQSQVFALAVIFAVIVMYDAAGIRRHAGEQAIAINNLEAKIGKYIERPHPSAAHEFYQKKLKEMLGHRPIEVFVGSLFGILIGSCFAML